MGDATFIPEGEGNDYKPMLKLQTHVYTGFLQE
jgi:hypothetical protein